MRLEVRWARDKHHTRAVFLPVFLRAENRSPSLNPFPPFFFCATRGLPRANRGGVHSPLPRSLRREAPDFIRTLHRSSPQTPGDHGSRLSRQSLPAPCTLCSRIATCHAAVCWLRSSWSCMRCSCMVGIKLYGCAPSVSQRSG